MWLNFIFYCSVRRSTPFIWGLLFVSESVSKGWVVFTTKSGLRQIKLGKTFTQNYYFFLCPPLFGNIPFLVSGNGGGFPSLLTFQFPHFRSSFLPSAMYITSVRQFRHLFSRRRKRKEGYINKSKKWVSEKRHKSSRLDSSWRIWMSQPHFVKVAFSSKIPFCFLIEEKRGKFPRKRRKKKLKNKTLCVCISSPV